MTFEELKETARRMQVAKTFGSDGNRVLDQLEPAFKETMATTLALQYGGSTGARVDDFLSLDLGQLANFEGTPEEFAVEATKPVGESAIRPVADADDPNRTSNSPEGVLKQVRDNIEELELEEKIAQLDQDIRASTINSLGESLKLNDFSRGINRASIVGQANAPGNRSELEGLGQSISQLNSDPQVEISRAPLQAVGNNFRERSRTNQIQEQVVTLQNRFREQNKAALLNAQSNLDKTTAELVKTIQKGLLDTRDSEKDNG